MSDQTAEPGKEPNTVTVKDAQVTAPTKTTFGLGSFSLPTPESARQGFKLFLLFNSIIVLTVNGFPQIPLDARNLILQFSTVANLVANKIEDFYGLSTDLK